MKVLERGHIYKPAFRTSEGLPIADSSNQPTLVFVNKEVGRAHNGTTTQEVLRILLDRTRHCNNCQPHYLNEYVIYHLRQALVKHEMRALERKAEKGDIIPEYLAVGSDGHFLLKNDVDALYADNLTSIFVPHRPDWDRECNHPTAGE